MTGTLIREDLGSGVWVLQTDDGQTITLSGNIPAKLAGKRVKIEGKPSNSFGFGMMGNPTVAVRSIKPC